MAVASPCAVHSASSPDHADDRISEIHPVARTRFSELTGPVETGRRRRLSSELTITSNCDGIESVITADTGIPPSLQESYPVHPKNDQALRWHPHQSLVVQSYTATPRADHPGTGRQMSTNRITGPMTKHSYIVGHIQLPKSTYVSKTRERLKPHPCAMITSGHGLGMSALAGRNRPCCRLPPLSKVLLKWHSGSQSDWSLLGVWLFTAAFHRTTCRYCGHSEHAAYHCFRFHRASLLSGYWHTCSSD